MNIVQLALTKDPLAIDKAYTLLFESLHGELVLEDLRQSYGQGLIRKDKTGRVDQNACLIEAGKQQVYLDIMRRIERGRMA